MESAVMGLSFQALNSSIVNDKAFFIFENSRSAWDISTLVSFNGLTVALLKMNDSFVIGFLLLQD